MKATSNLSFLFIAICLLAIFVHEVSIDAKHRPADNTKKLGCLHEFIKEFYRICYILT